MDTPLTVGVECEIKLAFEEVELRAANAQIHDLELVKCHDPVIGVRAAAGMYKDKAYQNWCLHDPALEGDVFAYADETALQVFGCPDETLCDFRMYKDEPLRLVQHLLATRTGLASTLHADLSCKQTDYSQAPFSIQRDASLQGLTATQKLAAFPQTIMSIEQAARDVDCVGVELVSWPHSTASAARADVRDAAHALRSGLKHGFMTDEETGLHMHVGLVDGSPLPLRVLQNLFLLIVLFEDEFARLHPHHRRNGASNIEIESNRVEFLADGADAVTRWVPDPTSNTGRMLKQTCLPNYQSVAEIKAAIFQGVEGARDPRARFRLLTGGKQHAVNFSYCFRDSPAAATVEFRQHAGSLDADEVFHWYGHCAGLVGLARRYARENTTVLEALGIGCWDDAICLEDLWGEMRLPEESRVFYRQRIERFRRVCPDWTPFPPMWDVLEQQLEDETSGVVEQAGVDDLLVARRRRRDSVTELFGELELNVS